MQRTVMALAVLLATGAGLYAQNTPTPKTQPASDAKLDGYLKKWEEKMREVKTLYAQLGRVDKDKVLGSTTKYAGFAQYLRSGEGLAALNLAVLELKQDGKKETAEKIVCTGTYVYVFAPAQKEIRAYELPKGGKTDGGFMDLLFGMKADDAKQRYNLTLVKEDQWYVYVDVAPKDAKDKADFARARLVLNKETYLPRQLWFEHSNGNEVTWDVPKVQTPVKLERRDFDAPKTPDGWKLVPMTDKKATVQPRVIRPSSEVEKKK